MGSHRFSLAACGLLIILVGRAGFAQEVGDTVRAKQAVELKVENEVVASVAAGDALTVRKLSGKWLWVQTDNGTRGWVLKESVRLGDEPSESGAAPPARLPPAVTARPAEAKSGNDPWLLAIGVLAGQNIYTTYAYIGAVADGYAYETYNSNQVQQLMAEVSSMSKVATDNLQQVRDSNIVAEDRAAIENVIRILTLLSEEADALATYARTNADKDLKAYDEARTNVWPMVRDMLQLE